MYYLNCFMLFSTCFHCEMSYSTNRCAQVIYLQNPKTIVTIDVNPILFFFVCYRWSMPQTQHARDGSYCLTSYRSSTSSSCSSLSPSVMTRPLWRPMFWWVPLLQDLWIRFGFIIAGVIYLFVNISDDGMHVFFKNY